MGLYFIDEENQEERRCRSLRR